MWHRRSDRKANPLRLCGLFLGLCCSLPGTARPLPEFIRATVIFETENRNPSENRLWVRVNGFSDSTYFSGRVQLLEKGKVVGYLYRPRQPQIYIYGEITALRKDTGFRQQRYPVPA